MKVMKEENSTITDSNELDGDIAKLKAIRSDTRSAHMDQLEDIERQLLQIEEKYQY